MRLSQFFCTSTSQNLSVSFHLSALMTTSRSHRAASTIHSTGRAEFLLLGTCRGPSGSYSSWKNCSLQQLFFYSTRIHIYRLLLQGPQDIERISPVLFHSHLQYRIKQFTLISTVSLTVSDKTIQSHFHCFTYSFAHNNSLSLPLFHLQYRIDQSTMTSCVSLTVSDKTAHYDLLCFTNSIRKKQITMTSCVSLTVVI